MKTLRYSLMAVGFVLVLGGIVAVINFDQPLEVFSSAWWIIVGGWCFALAGTGMDIMHLFKMAKSEASYGVRLEANTAQGVERESTRI